MSSERTCAVASLTGRNGVKEARAVKAGAGCVRARGGAGSCMRLPSLPCRAASGQVALPSGPATRPSGPTPRVPSAPRRPGRARSRHRCGPGELSGDESLDGARWTPLPGAGAEARPRCQPATPPLREARPGARRSWAPGERASAGRSLRVTLPGMSRETACEWLGTVWLHACNKLMSVLMGSAHV